MENYDEKMNYSFEPAPEEPSRPPLEQAKEEIRRSGKHTGLKIAALLAAVAIVAGVGADEGHRRHWAEKPRRAGKERRGQRHGRAARRAGAVRSAEAAG